MLYLPAIELDDFGEVRIPCSSDDLITLCKEFIEFETTACSLGSLLANNPGLLVYMLARFRVEQGSFVEKRSDLVEWIDRSFFSLSIEFDCFEAFPPLNNVQQQTLLKWHNNATRKRAARFLQDFTPLNRRESLLFISRLWNEALELELSDRIARSPLNLSPMDDVLNLPIRHMWNACGKIQILKAEFESELLKRKLLAMKQLAYGASHEINNPLANIATRAQSLMSEESNASKRQRMSVIYSQAMRAHEMISDMMLFAQPPDVSFESVEVKPLIDQVVAELSSELKRQQIVVAVRQYPDTNQCDLDSTHFAVAMKAMVQNSIEAIGSDGEIRIQIWKRSENLIGISVADDGCGIDPEASDQVFDPFYSGREAGRGLGFGLSKVWRIVELHGGDIKLQPDERWATRFVMSFPQRQIESKASNHSRIDNSKAA